MVYDLGTRIAGPLFAAFCLCRPEFDGPKIGFTVPRALGNAVVRNRLRRRFREAVRFRISTGRFCVFSPDVRIRIAKGSNLPAACLSKSRFPFSAFRLPFLPDLFDVHAGID